MFSSIRTLDATGVGDAKLHCVCCGAKCYVRASARLDGLGCVVVRFVLPSRWQAAVIDAVVGVQCPDCFRTTPQYQRGEGS